MYHDKPFLPNIREARAWGYEIKYGPWSLESREVQKDGLKPTPICEPAGEVSSLFMTAEGRIKCGQSRRLIISAWLSKPVVGSPNAELKAEIIYLHRVLRKLMSKKAGRFLRERANV